MADPRFVASLQTDDDPCCYKDFFETETLKEAKKEAEVAAKKHNKAALVFDRKAHFIVYKVETEKKPEQEEPAPVRKPRKK